MTEIDSGPFRSTFFQLGHWTHPGLETGCTVILADDLVPAAVDIRGGAPGTREIALLGSGMSVQRVDAILLTGGSAFGLAAADGVMRWLKERRRGFQTQAIPVPIVSGAVIFDLVGDMPDLPDSDAGYAAVDAAERTWISGRTGAGAGARVSKALGRAQSLPSGIGIAQRRTAVGTVSAVVVNNAFGDVVNPETGALITTPGGLGRPTEELLMDGDSRPGRKGENTVIGAIVVDRPLDHDALTRIAVAGSAGVAQGIRPAHTPADGDVMFALASGRDRVDPADLMMLTSAAQLVVAKAVVNAVQQGP